MKTWMTVVVVALLSGCALTKTSTPKVAKSDSDQIRASIEDRTKTYLDQQSEELKKVADTERTGEGIIVTLKGNALFDSGAYELKPVAKEQIKQIANVLKSHDSNLIIVAGHADNTGSADANKKLSEKRAMAVKDYLVSKGVRADIIQAEGKGSSEPVASNDTEAGRAKNRRVEIIVGADSTRMH